MTTMLPNPAALFLRRNPDLVHVLTEYLNKQQQLHATVVTLMTGTAKQYPAINAELVLAAVDKQGPDILRRLILAMDKQMDDVFKTMEDAVLAEQAAQAAAAQPPAIEPPAAEQPAPVAPVIVPVEADAGH